MLLCRSWNCIDESVSRLQTGVHVVVRGQKIGAGIVGQEEGDIGQRRVAKTKSWCPALHGQWQVERRALKKR